MDRLTRKMPGGYGLVEGRQLGTVRNNRAVVDRLAAYENTGLEPDQVDQIRRAAEHMMFESVGDFVRYSIANFEAIEAYRTLGSIDHLRDLIQAEKDGKLRIVDWAELDYIIPFERLNEAGHLLKAKDDGQLAVLPCKVGDTVYEVRNNTDACNRCDSHSDFYGMDEMCDAIDGEERYCPRNADRPLCEKQFMEVIGWTPPIDYIFDHREDFGKTIFLTRKAAEAALGGAK